MNIKAKEVFKTELGTLYLGDAREILKQIPSSTVDAVITDPPWGVGFDEYDDFKVFLDVRDELYRVMKPDSWLVAFIATKRLFDLVPLLKKFEYKWLIVNINLVSSEKSRNPFGGISNYQAIIVFSKGKPKTYLKKPDVIFSTDLPILEEMPKDLQYKGTYTALILISMFSKEGDLVLDPFAGYGSIPLVCELFDRRWIGIEIDPIKYEIAKKIISEKKIFNIEKMKKELKKRGQIGLTQYMNK